MPTQSSSGPDPLAVRSYLQELQDRICASLEALDGEARFREERLEGPGGTLARPRALEGGPVIEKTAVHFTHARGPKLPPAASEAHPHAAGQPFQAVSLSMIVHPRNPYAPTTHMNLRCFCTEGDSPTWWFGGGFDLTPYYGFDEDCVHWHREAATACEVLGPGHYEAMKKACDEYFYLPHRGEPRGIGGIFFDDLNEGGFDACFAFVRAVGDHFLPAYLPIVERRRDTPYGERERRFQCLRRGRYAEFNLVYDRGTKYGLQSGRRIESVLASLPPLVEWRYDWQPEPGSPEARLLEHTLQPRDWLAEGA